MPPAPPPASSPAHPDTMAKAHVLLLSLLLTSACGAPEPAAVRPAQPAPSPAVVEPARRGPMREIPGVPNPGSLRGEVTIDGSSTVFPITEAVSRELLELAPGVTVRLGVSGTGGGFAKFCAGETVISNASRPIKSREIAECRARGIDFFELPVAFDGLSVVIHPSNSWADCLTVAELRTIWEPAAEGATTLWSQVRAGWPEQPLHLYAPGRDSGTFDYFTSAINGEEGACRGDYTGSEDDYLLAQDIAADPSALGFFGYAYYHEYRDRLKIVAIDGGDGCIAPSLETISEGRYQPLSRPIFIYVRADALERREVRAFVDFYLASAPELVGAVGYVPLPARAYRLAAARVQRGLTGSVFSGGSQVGVSMEHLLELESETAVH